LYKESDLFNISDKLLLLDIARIESVRSMREKESDFVLGPLSVIDLVYNPYIIFNNNNNNNNNSKELNNKLLSSSEVIPTEQVSPLILKQNQSISQSQSSILSSNKELSTSYQMQSNDLNTSVEKQNSYMSSSSKDEPSSSGYYPPSKRLKKIKDNHSNIHSSSSSSSSSSSLSTSNNEKRKRGRPRKMTTENIETRTSKMLNKNCSTYSKKDKISDTEISESKIFDAQRAVTYLINVFIINLSI